MNKNGEDNNINLIYFSAEWCRPCGIQDHIINDLKKKFGDKINLKKIDIDNTEEDIRNLLSRYSIYSVPSMIFEKNGKMYRKYVGMTDEKILTRIVEEIMNEN